MMTKNRVRALNEESAVEEVAKLMNITEADGGGVTVYSGRHPEHGNVDIVVPAFGISFLLLPFVSQSN